MKIVFMGTPDFSVPVLENLIKNHEVVAIVTQMDKPRGRGKEISFSPVKEVAVRENITCLQPKRARDEEFIKELSKYPADVFVVVAYGQILPKAILDMPKYGCVNVHASLLPKLRGAAPIQWSVIDGFEKTGVTTMLMDEGLDTGDILEQKEVIISDNETGGSLFDKLSLLGADIILSTLDKLEKGTVTRTKQTDEESTYAGKIDKQMGNIDFSKDAVSIERLIRGLFPWPSAFTYLNGKMFKILAAEVSNKNYTDENGERLKPGTIALVNTDAIVVQTGEGSLEIYELQPEGKKRMCTSDYLRGAKNIQGMFVKDKEIV